MYICYNILGGVMVIQFPKRLKFSKENPIVDFYKKCMLQINDTSVVDNVNVTAFTVNPQDYKKLNEILKKHIKKCFPFLTPTKLKFEMGMVMLDIGPRVSKDVKIGTVLVDKEELYGDIEVKIIQ